MPASYNYTRELSGTDYNIDNINMVNEKGDVITLKDYVSIAGKTHDVFLNKGVVSIVFNASLTGAEKTSLDTQVNDYKNYEGSLAETIARDWKTDYVDFKEARQALKDWVEYNGFDNIVANAKKIVSRWFVVDKTDRDTVHTQQEQEDNAVFSDINCNDSRRRRYNIIQSIIFNRLNSTDTNTVVDDIFSNNLENLYITNGREGTDEDGSEGLFDYIEARAGTSYASTGLSAKGFTPVYGTLQAVVDDCMAVLQNGKI